MSIEIQNNFTQGLNDRLPPYKISEDSVQEAVDCDFSFGDARGVTGVGSVNGGTDFYYEAGTAWVGKDGVGGQETRPIKTFLQADNGTSTNQVSTNVTYGSPVTAEFGAVVIVDSGVEISVDNTIISLASAQSFVEYNDDLYISRDDEQIEVASVVSGSVDLVVGASNIYKFVVGDGIQCEGFPEIATVTEISIANATISLDIPATQNVSNAVCIIKGVPVRFIDGNLENVYAVGLPKPNLGITVGQISASQNSARASSYSAAWYSQNPPVTFQYGIARYDDATGAEGGISDLSDLTQAEAQISPTNNNLPLTVEFNKKKLIPEASVTNVSGSPIQFTILSHEIETGNRVQFTAADITGATLPSPLTETGSYYAIYVDQDTIEVATSFPNSISGTAINYDGATPTSGNVTIHYGSPENGKYAVYRTGGTSTVLNKVCNLYYKDDFYLSSINPSQNCLDIVPLNYPSDATLKAYFYTTNGTRLYSTSHTYNAEIASNQGVFVGVDPSDGSVHFSTNSSNSHAIDVIFTCKFPDDDREYVLTGDKGGSLNVNATTYTTHHLIDAKKPSSLIPIEPAEGSKPIQGLRFLTEVNDFFFGAVGKRVYVSSYGRPNVWPLDGFVDFDSNITALKRRGGELIVFNEHGLYRVYGTSHNGMRKVKVPTVEGVKSGLHRCISEIRDGLIYVSHSGISYFNGRDVQVLTQLRLGDFSLPSDVLEKNVGGVVEDVYYLLGPSADGYIVDMRFGTMKLSKCTFRANNLFYRGVENKLYTEVGVIGEGEVDKFTFKTRAFTGGDITKEKLLRFFRINGFNFSGTVELYADQQFVESFSIEYTPELNRSIYPRAAIIGNTFSLKFKDCTGTVQTAALDFIPIEETPLTRYDSVTFSYVGSPTVRVKVDNVGAINDTVLTDTGTGNTSTSTLYFPSMTEGHIVHISADETEDSRVMSYKIAGEVI